MKQTKNAKLFFTSTNPPKKNLTSAVSHNVYVKLFAQLFEFVYFPVAIWLFHFPMPPCCYGFFMFNWLHYTLQFGSVSWSSEAVSVVCGHDDGVLASLIAPFFLTVAGAKSKNQRKKFPFFCSQQKKHHANRGKCRFAKSSALLHYPRKTIN